MFSCSYPVFTTQKLLSAAAGHILQEEFGESTSVHFDVSMEESRGDLTTSIALQLGKRLGKSPREVASKLASGLKGIAGVSSVSIAGPGFINVSLSGEAILSDLVDPVELFTPRSLRKGDDPVIVEYSSPNIAKPFGVHHILTTIIGQSLANIYRHLGYNVIAIDHIGDWGTQFGKLSVAHRLWGSKSVEDYSVDELLQLYVRFHEQAERSPELEDEARAAFSQLEHGDDAQRQFWKVVVEVTMDEVQKTFDRLGITFDETIGESFYEDKMAPIIDEGKKKGIMTVGEQGSLVVEFPEETKLPTALITKHDGSTLYLTRDLATVRYRVDRWHPQAIVYVVGAEQQNHFQQLFEIVRMLGWTLPHLEHVLFGRMRFSDKSMSTRKGNILRLEHVLDEAKERAIEIIKERGEKIQTDNPDALAEMMGVGAVVYGVLSQNRKIDMVFDWDKMLSFEGNSAPYLQYTYARARSVLRKAGKAPAAIIPAVILTPHERHLAKLLLMFPDALEDARKDHAPHKVTVHLYSLCQAFNSFYNSDEILTAAEPQRSLRLGLTDLTSRVLKTGAELLTLRVPERM